MKRITYTEEYSQNSFASFIESLGHWQSEKKLVLDPESGHGVIRFFDVDPGLQLRVWDCTFFDGVDIARNIYDVKQDRTFTLVYYLTPDSVLLEDCQNSNGTINSLWNTVIMSSDATFRVKVLPGKPLRCVSLNFTPEWLEKNILCDITAQNNLLKRFAMTTNPFVMFESFSAIERKLLSNLVENGDHHLFGKFFLRSKSLNILTEFFTKIIGRLSMQSGTEMYHEKQMAEVEKELLANIHDHLPNLKLLAQKLSLSESTLKRYFKRIYGKNIYNYFLEKKMAFARTLLEDRQTTVSETAYMVGYEKVSHFSDMFKRFYGTQPGALRKLKVIKD